MSELSLAHWNFTHFTEISVNFQWVTETSLQILTPTHFWIESCPSTLPMATRRVLQPLNAWSIKPLNPWSDQRIMVWYVCMLPVKSRLVWPIQFLVGQSPSSVQQTTAMMANFPCTLSVTSYCICHNLILMQIQNPCTRRAMKTILQWIIPSKVQMMTNKNWTNKSSNGLNK